MDLKDVVPPLALCQMIPAGEFANSALLWMEVVASATHEKTWSLMQGTDYARSRPNRKIPAPTLQEIMEKLPHSICYRHALPGGYTMRTNNRFETFLRDESAATAALKLWLKMEGIE